MACNKTTGDTFRQWEKSVELNNMFSFCSVILRVSVRSVDKVCSVDEGCKADSVDEVNKAR